MARLYRVEMTFDQEDLVNFINDNPRYKVTVIALSPEPSAPEAPSAPVPAPRSYQRRGQVIRAKRKSKVIEAILKRLQGEAASVSELKGALEEAGMSVTSLSTGLAILQRSGQVRRDSNGAYYLAVKEAAE